MTDGMLSAIIGGLIATPGAVVPAVAIYLHSVTRNRAESALDLSKRFLEGDMYESRQAVSKMRLRWEAGDPAIREEVLCFFQRTRECEFRIEETPGPNGLLPHQNLSVLLYFLSHVQKCVERGTADRQIVKDMFRHHYSWYVNFINWVIEVYKSGEDHRRGLPEPIWVRALPAFQRTLELTQADLDRLPTSPQAAALPETSMSVMVEIDAAIPSSSTLKQG